MTGPEAMKGPPQQLLSIRRRYSEFKFYRFRDGSFAIYRDGSTVGVWEPDQQAAAIQTLADILGLPGGGRAVRLAAPEPDARNPGLN